MKHMDLSCLIILTCLHYLIFLMYHQILSWGQILWYSMEHYSWPFTQSKVDGKKNKHKKETRGAVWWLHKKRNIKLFISSSWYILVIYRNQCYELLCLPCNICLVLWFIMGCYIIIYTLIWVSEIVFAIS